MLIAYGAVAGSGRLRSTPVSQAMVLFCDTVRVNRGRYGTSPTSRHDCSGSASP
jgi:hypothetical protein